MVKSVLRPCVTSLLVSVVCAVAQVTAGEAEPEAEAKRPYLGVGFAYITEQFDVDGLTTGGTPVEPSDSLGVDIRAGYRLHRHVAAEAGFQYYDAFDFERAGSEVASGDAFSLTLNTKLYPFVGVFQPYGLLGIGFLHTELEDSLGLGRERGDTEFAGRLGMGLDVNLTQDLVASMEFSYLLPAGNLDDFRLLPIVWGIQYRLPELPGM